MDNLNQENKEILCNLFVDRIEMYRRKLKDGKYETSAEIHLRFDPKNI